MKYFIQAFMMLLAAGPPCHAVEPHSQEVYGNTVQPFLKAHCYPCHDVREAQAGLRLDQLGTDFLAGKNADMWKEVIDRINLGEMPPEDEPRPDAEQAFAVVEWVGRELKAAERQARMAGGRVLIRRLNRSEYANTVRDLLHLEQNFVDLIEEELPGDGKAEGFDRISSALLFDETQLSTYISLAGRIAEKAIVDSDTPPPTKKVRMELEDLWRPDKKTQEVIQYQKDTAIPSGPEYSKKLNDGVEFLQPVRYGGKDEFGHLGHRYYGLLKSDSVPRNGYYRIRMRAGAFRGKRGEPVRIQWIYGNNTPIQSVGEIEIEGTLQEPQVVEAIMFLRKPPEDAKPSLRYMWNGLADVIMQNPELSRVTSARLRATSALQKLVGAKSPGAEIDQAKAEVDRRIAEAREYSQQPDAVAKIYNPDHDLKDIPRLFIDWIEFEGPIEAQWPPASHAALFPDGLHVDPGQVSEVFSRFLPRAYRRPVTNEEIQQIVTVVRQGRDQFDLNDVDAMRFGLQTALSTPEFLYLFEPSTPDSPSRRLNDYELASRLSYFLWSSMPDDELLALAAEEKLQDPNILRQQVRRMIANGKSREFIENFAGQWLHVRDYDSVMPANDYKQYDDELRQAQHEEVYAFFSGVLLGDQSILNFLDSDFAVVNQRLAEFYGIKDVRGPKFRKVTLPPDSPRGGVLTMGGLLTYLSDGTRTLPVRRGAWILEEIFNDPPPPPPPNAGEIQPNVKGEKLTVRQRLEMHRNEPTCASCHAKIDPLGLALENFDAIGAWRTRQNGEGFRGNGPPIDAAGTLPSGRSFDRPDEFKQVLLEEKDRFARAFATKMLTYALGRPVSYADHQTLDAIVEAVKKDGYRMHSLIQAIVASEPFQTK